MREMIGSHTLAVVTDKGYTGVVLGVGRVCNGESCLGNDNRKGFLRGVRFELPNEGVGDVDGGHTVATACAKALEWPGKHVAFESAKEDSLEKTERVRGPRSHGDFSLLVSWGCVPKYPRLGGLRQLKWIRSQFWRPEVRIGC